MNPFNSTACRTPLFRQIKLMICVSFYNPFLLLVILQIHFDMMPSCTYTLLEKVEKVFHIAMALKDLHQLISAQRLHSELNLMEQLIKTK